MYADEGRAAAVNRIFAWVRAGIVVLAAVLLALKLSGAVSWWLVFLLPTVAYVIADGSRGLIHGTWSIRDHKVR